jgi:Putative addiction module component
MDGVRDDAGGIAHHLPPRPQKCYLSSMNQRVKDLADAARQLSIDERRDLVEILQYELGDGTPEEIEAAWIAEVDRRIERADRGEGKFVDFDDAIASARARIPKS